MRNQHFNLFPKVRQNDMGYTCVFSLPWKLYEPPLPIQILQMHQAKCYMICVSACKITYFRIVLTGTFQSQAAILHGNFLLTTRIVFSLSIEYIDLKSWKKASNWLPQLKMNIIKPDNNSSVCLRTACIQLNRMIFQKISGKSLSRSNILGSILL